MSRSFGHKFENYILLKKNGTKNSKPLASEIEIRKELSKAF
jgi:hypothetical protein